MDLLSPFIILEAVLLYLLSYLTSSISNSFLSFIMEVRFRDLPPLAGKPANWVAGIS